MRGWPLLADRLAGMTEIRTPSCSELINRAGMYDMYFLCTSGHVYRLHRGHRDHGRSYGWVGPRHKMPLAFFCPQTNKARV
jgi:hypothetical protein